MIGWRSLRMGAFAGRLTRGLAIGPFERAYRSRTNGLSGGGISLVGFVRSYFVTFCLVNIWFDISWRRTKRIVRSVREIRGRENRALCGLAACGVGGRWGCQLVSSTYDLQEPTSDLDAMVALHHTIVVQK